MSEPRVHIIPYEETYNIEALDMEKAITQGSNVQLEILKDHFLDRARVFENYYGCLAVADKRQLVGSAVAAKTIIHVNGEIKHAGIGFDGKVAPAWRKKGIGRQLTKHLYNHFFAPNRLTDVFMTAKMSNLPVLNLIKRTVPGTSLYHFVYLTIPAKARLKIKRRSRQIDQLFFVRLFNSGNLPAEYYNRFENGLGCFYTSKMYRLKIKKISTVYKACISALKIISPAKYAGLPAEGEALTCATLFDHTAENIHDINEVLEKLEAEGIGQLLVCCRKNDAVYNAVSTIAIHTYNYCVVSDFLLNKDDELTIDARCL